MIAKRTDHNQAEIVSALRQAGASVSSLASLGHGIPDVLVGFRGRNYLIEIKSGDRAPKLTDSETQWIKGWQGQVGVITSVRDALAIIIEDDGDVNDPT